MQLVKKLLHKLVEVACNFKNEERAVAAVEFALILPAMLLLYVGTSEVSRLIIMDRKLAVVAGSVADLVARSENSIQDTVLDDYFTAADFTMSPYPTGSLAQVVTSVTIDQNGVATVVWSEGFNGGVALATGSRVDLPAEITNISTNGNLIIGNATVDWQPIIDFIFASGFTLERTFYFRPRFGSQIDLVS